MGDFLLELGSNPLARKAIRRLGLPIPLPQPLRRAEGPWEERPLEGQPVVVGLASGSELAPALGPALDRAGAVVYLTEPLQLERLREAAGEWRQPPTLLAPGDSSAELRPHALVYDATGLEGPEALSPVYELFHAWIKRLAPCGRVVVLARPASEAGSPRAAAASQALDGFIRGVGRECGRLGSTAQTVYVEKGAEGRLEPVLRFLLSPRAAYISGQPIRVSARVELEGPAPFTRPLEGRVALVTGAARGIGAQTARALAREGARVIVMDLPDPEGTARRLASEIGGIELPCDLSAPDSPELVTHFLREHFGGVDIVVHNAGITRDKMLGNMKPEQWDQVLDVNLIALITLNEALLPLLRPGGRVVCLASIAGIAGNMGQSNYAASKAGVIGYVRALAPRVAGRGITINAVAPGFIETRMTAAIPMATREVARRLCNLGQGGLPQDVAEAIAFLASPGAAAITGEVLRVCGGNYLGA